MSFGTVKAEAIYGQSSKWWKLTNFYLKLPSSYEPLTSRTSEHVFPSCQDSTARLPCLHGNDVRTRGLRVGGASFYLPLNSFAGEDR